MKNADIVKRIFFLSLCVCVLIPVASAQIRGTVVDASHAEALPFANITVIDKDISATYPGVVADMDGNFVLEVPKEKVAVRISFMGYLTKDTVLVKATLNRIALAEDANMLGEVVVKGKRNLFKMEHGGIAMDIANSPLKNVGTANDVLAKQPFIVKGEEGISVLGKGVPLIYINKRLVRNNNELEKLSSNNIKKVTVITNPGPEYDATANAVVLIEATRPPGEGLGGELFGRMKVHSKISADGMTDLNYRKNKLDLFASYWYSIAQSRTLTTANREQELKDGTLTVDNKAHQLNHSRSNYIDGGFNYEFNEKHSLGAKYTYNNTPYYHVNLDMTTDVAMKGGFSEDFSTTSSVDINDNSHLLNAYYTGDLFSWLSARVNFDYACGDSDNRQLSVSAREDEVNVSTLSLQSYDLYAGKLALITPLWGSNLQYGIEYSRTVNEQNYIVDQAEGTEGILPDANLSKQKLLAAFLEYSKTFGNWYISAGLRYEYAKFDYFVNDIRMDGQSRKYSNLFPSASVSYRNQKVQAMLGYRSTTARPSYHQLRNSIQYDDPYTYETGNPFLLPMKKEDVTFSFLWNNLQFMASYQMYHNLSLGIHRPYEENPNIVISRPENLDRMQNLSASAYYFSTFGCWSPMAGLGVAKNYLSFGTPAQDYNKPYLFYSFSNTFKLPAGFTLMIDMQGNTRGHSMQVFTYNSFMLNASLTKTFMNGNLILDVKGGDILGTYKQKNLTEVYPVKMLLEKDMDTRYVGFSIRYKFNATKGKYKGESASEEERRRM